MKISMKYTITGFLTLVILVFGLMPFLYAAEEKKEKSPGEIPIDNSNAQQTYDKAMRLIEMKSWDDAIGWLNKSITANPDNDKAWFYRGYCYYKKIDKTVDKDINREVSDIGKALQNFNRAFKINPENYKALEYRALTYLLPGTTPTLALEDLDKLVEKFPNRSELYFYRGKTYNQMGYLNEALENLQVSIQMNPRQSDAYRELWYSYDLKEHYNTAIDYFDSLLLVYTDIPEIHFYKGRALFEKGEYQKAAKSFTNALSVKPDYPEAREWKNKALKKY